MKYGYARVSTDDQTTDLQEDALLKAGCEIIFYEQGVSGSKRSRPELDRLLTTLQPGDTVVVWRLDRLGRSLSHLIELIEQFKDQGVNFESVTEKIDTSSAVGQLIFNIFGAFAQFERETIRERVKAGIQASIKRGKTWNASKRIPEGEPMSRATRYRRLKDRSLVSNNDK
jgi:DNA invertase Pin-like site-specific DNA recombinase